MLPSKLDHYPPKEHIAKAIMYLTHTWPPVCYLLRTTKTYAAIIEGKIIIAAISAICVLRPRVQKGTAANPPAMIVARTTCGHQGLAAMDASALSGSRPFLTRRFYDRPIPCPVCLIKRLPSALGREDVVCLRHGLLRWLVGFLGSGACFASRPMT
jgi:hypothetical protein